MKLEQQIKIALGESRLLMLGAQVLFGFQFNGIFQELFVELPSVARQLSGLGLTLLMLSIGLLIAPSMQHRLLERGADSVRLLIATTLLTSWAMLPFSVALALDIAITLQRIVGTAWGTAAGATFFALAMVFLYALEFLLKQREPPMRPQPEKPPPLSNQVEQLLTEARLIIPGAQALLGFQLTVVFTRAFQELGTAPKSTRHRALQRRLQHPVAHGAGRPAPDIIRGAGQPRIHEDRIGVRHRGSPPLGDRDRARHLCGGRAGARVADHRGGVGCNCDPRFVGILVRISDCAASDLAFRELSAQAQSALDTAWHCAGAALRKVHLRRQVLVHKLLAGVAELGQAF